MTGKGLHLEAVIRTCTNCGRRPWAGNKHTTTKNLIFTCTCTGSSRRSWAGSGCTSSEESCHVYLNWLLQKTISGVLDASPWRENGHLDLVQLLEITAAGSGHIPSERRAIICTCTGSCKRLYAGSGWSTPEGIAIICTCVCTCIPSCRSPWAGSGCTTPWADYNVTMDLSEKRTANTNIQTNMISNFKITLKSKIASSTLHRTKTKLK